MKKLFNLYFFGFVLGLHSILKLMKINLRILEMLFTPMNYSRLIETPLVLNGISPISEKTFLDIGSPKLLSFYLAKKSRSTVISSDLNPYFLEYSREFSKVLDVSKRYIPKILDATKIDLPNSSIDCAYALSVFEHISGKGDELAMNEVYRVLKKGGTFVLTLPYGDFYKNQYRNPKKFYYSKNSSKSQVFYQRIYDHQNLFERIVLSSNLKLIQIEYGCERISLPFINSITSFIGPINLVIHSLNHFVSKVPIPGKTNIVYLVFKK